MNISYLDRAKERVNNVPLLINMVSRRVRQLISGQRPLVKPDSPNQPPMEIALKEIAEGKLTAELGIAAQPRPSNPDNFLTL
ncbi:MAG: DNA-directed RNA polymerase subunit omega [Kiritimatiellae bacterium]|nr:DNA-directed RNA polymerase subunit omega [Kiritimatiellia bacterium]MDW8458769.1 DNA-directed RNA polymerase subunit omega [Verrucomicrobiota bacterium]